MNKWIILLAMSLFFLQSCSSDKATETKDEATSETSTDESSGVEIMNEGNERGAAFEMVNVQELGSFLDFMETEGIDEMDGIVTGKVASVCQVKGCWMNVISEENDTIFVKFNDYAYFMPKDLAGESVTMKGTVFKETTSVDELRHYAEDAKASKEEIAAITQPKEELKFMASGVVIQK